MGLRGSLLSRVYFRGPVKALYVERSIVFQQCLFCYYFLNHFGYVKQALNSSSFQSAKKLLYFLNSLALWTWFWSIHCLVLEICIERTSLHFSFCFHLFNIILMDKLGQLKRQKKRQVKRRVILINKLFLKLLKSVPWIGSALPLEPDRP